jgi:transcriptional regulator with XRE-family HTH domain
MEDVLEASKIPVNPESPSLAKWLEERCRKEGLSSRQAAAKVGVSHATIASIKKGIRPSYATIMKLANAFSNNGEHQRAALENHLLNLCGYRSGNVTEVKSSEPLARLMDKLSKLDEGRLKVVESFVDFSATLGNGNSPCGDQS